MTLAKGLSLLQTVVGSKEPRSIGELAREAHLDRNSAYRLIKELERQGLVARQSKTGGYVMGSALIALSTRVLSRLDLRVTARPVLEQLSSTTTETVSLHIRHFNDRLCIDSVDSQHPIRRVVPLGQQLPLYTGVTGAAFLAHMPETEAEGIIAEAISMGHVGLPQQLAKARELGYAAAIGLRVAGVGGIAFPVFSRAGLAAVITVSGPADRCTLEFMEKIAPAVGEHISALSASLGYDAPGGVTRDVAYAPRPRH
jgi:IclR family transcriptional regulator, KDG regulon repressor